MVLAWPKDHWEEEPCRRRGPGTCLCHVIPHETPTPMAGVWQASSHAHSRADPSAKLFVFSIVETRKAPMDISLHVRSWLYSSLATRLVQFCICPWLSTCSTLQICLIANRSLNTETKFSSSHPSISLSIRWLKSACIYRIIDNVIQRIEKSTPLRNALFGMSHSHCILCW